MQTEANICIFLYTSEMFVFSAGKKNATFFKAN